MNSGKKYLKRVFLNEMVKVGLHILLQKLVIITLSLKSLIVAGNITLENCISKPSQRANAISKLKILRDTANEMIIHIEKQPLVLKFGNPHKKESFISKEDAEKKLMLKYNKTTPPLQLKNKKLKNKLVSFWQIEKEYKSAILVLSEKAKKRKFQIQYFDF